MDGIVTKIELDNQQMENLPLFFKTIFFNPLTNLEDEMKLFKYNSKLQANYMRHFDPSRIICKTFDIQILKEDE
jgi:hypothetical protein